MERFLSRFRLYLLGDSCCVFFPALSCCFGGILRSPSLFYRAAFCGAFFLGLILAGKTSIARDSADYCHSIYCDPNHWLRYRASIAGLPYGNSVRLGSLGVWVLRDRPRLDPRVMRYEREVPFEDGWDFRIAENTYRRAYSSFQRGQKSGRNKVEDVYIAHRWKKRITTEDGIVLLKDDFNNVALQGPSGKWHVVNGRGEYAVTTVSLSAPTELERIAKADLDTTPLAIGKPDVKLAKIDDSKVKKESSAGKTVAKANGKKNRKARSLASVSVPDPSGSGSVRREALASQTSKEQVESGEEEVPAAPVAGAQSSKGEKASSEKKMDLTSESVEPGTLKTEIQEASAAAKKSNGQELASLEGAKPIAPDAKPPEKPENSVSPGSAKPKDAPQSQPASEPQSLLAAPLEAAKPATGAPPATAPANGVGK